MNSIQLQAHQQRIVDHMLSHRGLIAVHQTGSGKTIAAVATIKALQNVTPSLKTIVITSLSIMNQFKDEVDRWQLQNVDFFTPEMFMNMMDDDKRRPECKDIFLIVDEAHNVRTNVRYDSTNERTIKGQRSYGIMKAAQLASKVLLLTATPIINTPFDIYNLVMMVEGIAPEESITEKKFFEAIKDKRNFDLMFTCKTSFYSVPKHYKTQMHYLTMSNEYYQAYHKIETKNLAEKRGETIKDLLVNFNSTAENDMFFSILRQAINALDGEQSPKIDWVKQFCLDHTNEKTLVFSNWKNAGMNLVTSALSKVGISYVIIDGESSVDERKLALQKYNNNEVNVMLITRAGGEGLDLKSTRHVVIMESNWNEAIDEQIIGRAIRHNSHSTLPEDQRSVTVHRLMMRKPEWAEETFKSIDEEVYKIAYTKKKPLIDDFIKRIRNLSIEECTCTCKNQIRSITIEPSPFRKSLAIKTRIKKEVDVYQSFFGVNLEDYYSGKPAFNDYDYDMKPASKAKKAK